MINQQIIDFIKEQLQKGKDRELITKELLANGWTDGDVAEGYKAIVLPSSSVNNDKQNGRRILKSIWYWWFLATVMYLSLGATRGALPSSFAGFVGLFVPYGFWSLFYASMSQISALMTIASVIFFIFAMYWSNKLINKDSNSITKAIIINLLLLLFITMAVDLIRGTPFESWKILFLGGPQNYLSGLSSGL